MIYHLVYHDIIRQWISKSSLTPTILAFISKFILYDVYEYIYTEADVYNQFINSIDDIFENLYGDYIEESIIDIFQYEKKYTHLLNNTTPCDIEILFYSFINKETSIPGKYKTKEEQCKDNDIFSDDEY